MESYSAMEGTLELLPVYIELMKFRMRPLIAFLLDGFGAEGRWNQLVVFWCLVINLFSFLGEVHFLLNKEMVKIVYTE